MSRPTADTRKTELGDSIRLLGIVINIDISLSQSSKRKALRQWRAIQEEYNTMPAIPTKKRLDEVEQQCRDFAKKWGLLGTK